MNFPPPTPAHSLTLISYFRPIINSGDPETHCSLTWHGTGARRPMLTGHNATKGLR
jgi:hypothetical protein